MRSWCYYLSLDVVVAFVLYGGGSPVHLNAARKLVSCQSRIKKIMQKNAEIGRIAMAVPVIICILHTSLTSREKHLLLNVADDAWRVNYLTRLTEICPWWRWKVFSLIIFEEKKVWGVWDMGVFGGAGRVWPPDLQWPARALEIFLECLLTKTCTITQSKLSSVVSLAHM